MTDLTSPESFRRELLLQDLKTWNDSFWKNEGAGESRIKFYITLVTAVGGGLGALSQYGMKEGGNPALVEVSRELVPVALVGLLLFGFVTFTRMVRRNQVTDEYKEWGDQIRRHVLGDALFERIYALKPKEPKLRDLWNGGLASMMLFMNALVAGILVGCLLDPDYGIETAWVGGLFGFAAMVWAQRWFLRRRHEKARKDYKDRDGLRKAAGLAKADG